MQYRYWTESVLFRARPICPYADIPSVSTTTSWEYFQPAQAVPPIAVMATVSAARPAFTFLIVVFMQRSMSNLDAAAILA